MKHFISSAIKSKNYQQIKRLRIWAAVQFIAIHFTLTIRTLKLCAEQWEIKSTKYSAIFYLIEHWAALVNVLDGRLQGDLKAVWKPWKKIIFLLVIRRVKFIPVKFIFVVYELFFQSRGFLNLHDFNLANFPWLPPRILLFCTGSQRARNKLEIPTATNTDEITQNPNTLQFRWNQGVKNQSKSLSPALLVQSFIAYKIEISEKVVKCANCQFWLYPFYYIMSILLLLHYYIHRRRRPRHKKL